MKDFDELTYTIRVTLDLPPGAMYICKKPNFNSNNNNSNITTDCNNYNNTTHTVTTNIDGTINTTPTNNYTSINATNNSSLFPPLSSASMNIQANTNTNTAQSTSTATTSSSSSLPYDNITFRNCITTPDSPLTIFLYDATQHDIESHGYTILHTIPNGGYCTPIIKVNPVNVVRSKDALENELNLTHKTPALRQHPYMDVCGVVWLIKEMLMGRCEPLFLPEPGKLYIYICVCVYLQVCIYNTLVYMFLRYMV